MEEQNICVAPSSQSQASGNSTILDEQVCCSGGGCWLANCPGDRLSRKLPPIYH